MRRRAITFSVDIQSDFVDKMSPEVFIKELTDEINKVIGSMPTSPQILNSNERDIEFTYQDEEE